jgi:predicted metal-dependent hydrolase
MNNKMVLSISGISIEVVKKKIRNMHLYVKAPDGAVSVSAPLSMKDEVIEKFVWSKVDWIKKQIGKYENQPRQAERKYISGESVYVWGRQYYLQVILAKKNSFKLLGDNAILTVGQNASIKQRESVVRKWYRQQLTTEIEKVLPKWEQITGLKLTGFQIKYMKTRWGTCNTKAKKIWINLQLAQKPYECLDYIVLHEILHLLEKNHGKKFIALMDKFMPSWRQIKARLNGSVLDYMK